MEGLGLREGLQQVSGICEAAASGIGRGKVGNGEAGLCAEAMGSCESALFGIPGCSFGKAHKSNPVRGSRWLCPAPEISQAK